MSSNRFQLAGGGRLRGAGLKVVSGSGVFRLPSPLPPAEKPPEPDTGAQDGVRHIKMPRRMVSEDGANAVPGFYSMRYKLVKRIRGGQSVVYKAHDRELGMDVALKFLPGRVLHKEQRVEELKREATIAMRLTHENIVRLYTIELKNARPFLVMEYVEGETLRGLMDRLGALAIETMLGVARACISALEYAHKHGILHRDLKPENMMITAGGRLKILDFGTASSIGTLLVDHIEGTPGYMAPEQVAGSPCDARADVFGLGVVLWEMLTGRNAFPDRSDLAHMYDKPPAHRERIPGPIREVLARAMSLDPADRWTSVAEFGQALSGAAEKVL